MRQRRPVGRAFHDAARQHMSPAAVGAPEARLAVDRAVRLQGLLRREHLARQVVAVDVAAKFFGARPCGPTATGSIAAACASKVTRPVLMSCDQTEMRAWSSDDQRHGDGEPDLTAANTLADVDGLGAISYQWQRDGVNIAGATGSSLHAGASRRRPVASMWSPATPTGRARPRAWPVRQTPRGGQRQRRTHRQRDDQRHEPTQGQTLTAANTLADVDGLGAISYQWQRGGVDIAGATGSHLHAGTGRCRPVASVVASYTDGQGTAESVAIGRPPQWPTSTTRRPGRDDQRHDATQGQTLTAANTLADVDGLGAISYQWQRGGVTSPVPPAHLQPARPMSASSSRGGQLHRRPGHGRERRPARRPPRWPTSTTRPRQRDDQRHRRPRARR